IICKNYVEKHNITEDHLNKPVQTTFFKKTDIVKWTPELDNLLIVLIAKDFDWERIAAYIPKSTPETCSEHWKKVVKSKVEKNLSETQTVDKIKHVMSPALIERYNYLQKLAVLFTQLLPILQSYSVAFKPQYSELLVQLNREADYVYSCDDIGAD